MEDLVLGMEWNVCDIANHHFQAIEEGFYCHLARLDKGFKIIHKSLSSSRKYHLGLPSVQVDQEGHWGPISYFSCYGVPIVLGCAAKDSTEVDVEFIGCSEFEFSSNFVKLANAVEHSFNARAIHCGHVSFDRLIVGVCLCETHSDELCRIVVSIKLKDWLSMCHGEYSN
jgi:hypothetical protein